MVARRGLSEWHHCAVFVDWTKYVRYLGEPLFERLAHIPNERGGGGRAHVGKLMRIGFKPGFPDYLILAPVKGYAGLLLEAKRPDRHRITDNQRAWRDKLIRFGYHAEICLDADELVDATRRYFEGVEGFTDVDL